MPAVTMPRGRRLRAQSLAGTDELATRPATNPLANSRAARCVHRGAELLGVRLAARAKKISIEDLEHLEVSLVAGRPADGSTRSILTSNDLSRTLYQKQYLDVKTLYAENLPR
jgi:hypothetical protein